MVLSLVLLVVSTAVPLSGLDKPAKEERGTLGESALTKGKVKIYCADVGKWMLVEVNDPGLKGARDLWLRKKNGDAMPPCNEEAAGVTRLESAAQFGYFAGIKGGYAFVISADSASGYRGVRVFSLLDGVLVFDGEFNVSQPASVVSEGKSTLMRFHRELHARCQPTGDEAVSCWKELRADAKVPESVEIKPPPCDAVLKANPDMLGAMVSVPVEIDLASASTVKFRNGIATCSSPE